MRWAWTPAILAMRAERGDCVLPTPHLSPFIWIHLGPELTHGWLKIKLLLKNRDRYVDNLWSIIKTKCSNTCFKFGLYHLISN